MHVINIGKIEWGILAGNKGSRDLVEKLGKLSFDKGWTNRLHYEKRNVINLTSEHNPLGDNGVDQVDMVGIHVYFLHLETLWNL
jgi:hypothetical protein